MFYNIVLLLLTIIGLTARAVVTVMWLLLCCVLAPLGLFFILIVWTFGQAKAESNRAASRRT